MARQMYVQYTPILPLSLLGRIDAWVTSDSAPVYSNQLGVPEGTNTTGFQVDLVLLTLILI